MRKSGSPRTVKVHAVARDSTEFGHELRRARSEADLIRSRSAPASMLPVPLEEEEKDAMTELKRRAFTVQGMVTKEEPLEEEIEEERESFGSGMGKGGNDKRGGKGGRRGSGDQSENRGIHDRYAELLKSDPGNALILRNYGKFLHEVLTIG